MSTAKPVASIKTNGSQIEIDFAEGHKPPMKYDIKINGRVTYSNLFAEEVIRWLGKRLEEKH